jgi:hypothetical protein
VSFRLTVRANGSPNQDRVILVGPEFGKP